MNVLQIKEAVRQRDGFCCVDCGMSADTHRSLYGCTLDVHRLVPGSAYTVEGCVTQCIPCHGNKPKRARGQAMREDGRLGARIDAGLFSAFKGHVATMEPRTSTGSVLGLLIKRHLREKGLWPDAEHGQEDE